MKTVNVITAENRKNFDAQRVKKAFEARYKTSVDVDANSKIVAVAVDSKVFKQFKKICPKGNQFEAGIEKVVFEDFSDEFTQYFEDGVWVQY